MRSFLSFTFLTFALLLTGLSHSVSAEDWRQWRGEDRANHSPESGLFANWGSDGPPLAWMAEGLGSGYASVTVADGSIYTTGNLDDGQTVFAINTSDGSIQWKRPLTSKAPKHGYPGSRTTPTVSGDHLYLVTSDGNIVCVNRKDGSETWRRAFQEWGGKMMSGWGYSESPLVDGDLVICTPGGPKGMVVALDKNSGREIWSTTMPDYSEEAGLNGKPLKDGAGYASAVISNGAGVKQYIQLVGRGLIGIRASDGELLWRYDQVANGTANIPTAIVDGDYIFTSTGYNTGSALLKLVKQSNGVTPEEVYWLEGKQLQNKHGGMTLVDGYIYCGHGNGNGLPICVNMQTGETAWGPERAKGKGESTLVYADGHIVWRREDGTVMLVKATPEKLEILSSFKPVHQEGKTWAHPVISGGNLYLREQGKLMSYRLKD